MLIIIQQLYTNKYQNFNCELSAWVRLNAKLVKKWREKKAACKSCKYLNNSQTASLNKNKITLLHTTIRTHIICKYNDIESNQSLNDTIYVQCTTISNFRILFCKRIRMEIPFHVIPIQSGVQILKWWKRELSQCLVFYLSIVWLVPFNWWCAP